MKFLRHFFASSNKVEARSAEEQKDEFEKRTVLEAIDRSKALCANKQFEAALSFLDYAINHGHKGETAFCLRASCLQALKWHLDAIDDFTITIFLAPDDCNHHFQRAMSRSAIGDSQGFKADLETALKLSKADTPLNREYDEGAREMGHESYFSMIQLQLLIQEDESLASREMWGKRRMKGFERGRRTA